MADEIKFRLDLVQQAISHVCFLRTVHEAEDLRRRDVINAAIYRYGHYWLPLAAEHPTECLSAPLDIEWIWHCHMLAPGRYANDCNAVTNTVVNHTVRSGEEYEKALLTSEKYWQQKYSESGIPFQYDLSKYYKDTSNISFFPFGAVERQKKFFYQVSLPHYRDQKFLAGALARYKKFLHLKRAVPTLTVVPCFDIDLLWHTHQLNPCDYDRDSCDILGYRLVHDDNVGGQRTSSSQLHKDSVNTATHWQGMYREPYAVAGAMYRGPPLSLSKDSERPYLFMGVKVTSISIDTCYLNGGQLVNEKNYDEMKLVVASAKGDYFIGELAACTVPYLFRITELFDRPLSFDTTNNDKFELQFELFHKRQGMCFKHDKSLAKTTWRAPLSNIIHWLDKSKRTYDDRPKLGNGAHLSLEGSFSTSLSNMSELMYYLEEGSFRSAQTSEVGADMHTQWGPFPMEDPWQGDGTKACLVASHRLRYREKNTGWPFYIAKIVHIMPSSLFLIQIRDRKGHVVATAHMIGPEQLPQPDQVEKEDCVSLDQDKEMAILIKSAVGDWGILTGASTSASERAKADLEYDAGNRRGVEMNFYKLPEGKKLACNIDEKFMFFRTTGIEVNFVEGSVKMDPVLAFEMGEVLALAFSACFMIMLCTQETKRTNLSEGKQFHAETTDSQQVETPDDNASADNIPDSPGREEKEGTTYSLQEKITDDHENADNVTKTTDSVKETADSAKTNAGNLKENADRHKPDLDAWAFYRACALGQTSFNSQLVQSDVAEMCAVCAGYHSYTRAKLPSKEPPAPTRTAVEKAEEEERERDEQFWRHTKHPAGMCLGCGPSGCRGYR